MSLSASQVAFALNFSDSQGKIINKTSEYIIRLVETPHNATKTVEALFIARGEPITFNRVVSDFAEYPNFMPHIRSAEFVRFEYDRAVYCFAFKIALWTVRYTNIFTHTINQPDHYTLKWDYVKGDLKNTTGSWDIKRYNEKKGYSIIHYTLFIETGKLVPAWLENNLTAGAVPAMISAIDRRARFLENSTGK